ncbi:hypothetical protein [Acidovorax lacteus]
MSALGWTLPAVAGSPSESHVARPGLFFAWLVPQGDPVVVRFDDPALLRQLVQHCNAGKSVVALQTGIRYPCTAEAFKTPTGDTDAQTAGITVLAPARQSDRWEHALFSLAPPATPRWDVRPLKPDARTALQAYLQAQPQRFAWLQPTLQWSAAVAVRQPGAEAARETLVVPGRTVRKPEVFYQAQRHHVFVRDQGTHAYLGEVPGTPGSYVDVDGSDLPGLVVSEGCDGWCISLWSLRGGLRPIGRFGGH